MTTQLSPDAKQRSKKSSGTFFLDDRCLGGTHMIQQQFVTMHKKVAHAAKTVDNDPPLGSMFKRSHFNTFGVDYRSRIKEAKNTAKPRVDSSAPRSYALISNLYINRPRTSRYTSTTATTRKSDPHHHQAAHQHQLPSISSLSNPGTTSAFFDRTNQRPQSARTYTPSSRDVVSRSRADDLPTVREYADSIEDRLRNIDAEKRILQQRRAKREVEIMDRAAVAAAAAERVKREQDALVGVDVRDVAKAALRVGSAGRRAAADNHVSSENVESSTDVLVSPSTEASSQRTKLVPQPPPLPPAAQHDLHSGAEAAHSNRSQQRHRSQEWEEFGFVSAGCDADLERVDVPDDDDDEDEEDSSGDTLPPNSSAMPPSTRPTSARVPAPPRHHHSPKRRPSDGPPLHNNNNIPDLDATSATSESPNTSPKVAPLSIDLISTSAAVAHSHRPLSPPTSFKMPGTGGGGGNTSSSSSPTNLPRPPPAIQSARTTSPGSSIGPTVIPGTALAGGGGILSAPTKTLSPVKAPMTGGGGSPVMHRAESPPLDETTPPSAARYRNLPLPVSVADDQQQRGSTPPLARRVGATESSSPINTHHHHHYYHQAEATVAAVSPPRNAAAHSANNPNHHHYQQQQRVRAPFGVQMYDQGDELR